MISVIWLTDDRAIQPDIEQAVAFADAELRILTHIQDLPTTRVDVILWSPAVVDEELLPALKEHCHQVLILIPRSQHQDRLCPIKSPGAPRYYIVIPFDPEEVGVIIRYVVASANSGKTGNLAKICR